MYHACVKTHRSARDLLDVLDALDLPSGSWIATDADGTLWATDVADQSWGRLVAEEAMRPAAAAAMGRELELAGRPVRGDVHADARALYALYMAGEVDDWPLLRAMTFCYAGWSEGEWRAFGARLFRDLIAPRVYETTVPLLGAIRERGFRLAVVSGSARVLVEECLRELGFADVPVFGIDVERDGDVASARMRRPLTWEQGKLEALAPTLAGAPLEVAFGDTLGDLHLLRAARSLRVLVQPRPNLRHHARQAHPSEQNWCVLAPARTVGGHPLQAPESNRVID